MPKLPSAKTARAISETAEAGREIIDSIARAIMEAAPQGKTRVSISIDHLGAWQCESVKRVLRNEGYRPQECRATDRPGGTDLIIDW